MRRTLFLMLMLFLNGCAVARAVPAIPFPAGAPWYNVRQPLSLEQLRGRAVLLDFFTPGCINCIHVLPNLARLERAFGNDLIIVGVNSPKFAASQGSSNPRQFILQYHVTHPVFTDKNLTLWKAYGVFAWPTFVLINPKGEVVGKWMGEGNAPAIHAKLAAVIAAARADGTLRPQALPLAPLQARQGPLHEPTKIAVSGNRVAVADTGANRVLLCDRSGRIVRIIGDGRAGLRDGPASRAEFNGPRGLAFAAGGLYVADTMNHRIRRIDLGTFQVRSVAGTGRKTYGVHGAQPPLQAGLNSPWGLEAVGDTLYIAMAGDHQVWRMRLPTGPVGPFAGSGREGLGDGPRGQAEFAQSSGLAYHHGTLYVADPESSSVRAVHLRSGRVATLVGHGLFRFGDRNGPAAQALLQHDEGLAYVGGSLYIADTYNNQIRRLDLRARQVSTVAGGKSGRLLAPQGLAVFDAQTLLVVDSGNSRILRLNLKTKQLSPWPLVAR